MLPPIGNGERRLLIVVSACLCTASILLAPLAARSSIDVSASEELALRELHAPQFDTEPAGSRLAIARDPFAAEVSASAGDQSVTGSADIPRIPGGDSVVGMQVQSGAPIAGALPPNRGAYGTPLEGFGTTISAVITGDRSQVLVAAGGRSQILSVGDRLDGRKIVEITPDGVRFDDGTTRSVSERR